jgi:hypothetical protein
MAAPLNSALGRVGCSPEGDTTGEPENGRLGAGARFPAPLCPVCGRPILDPRATGRRHQHEACSRFKSHLNAAVREAARIGFGDAGEARAVRALLLGAANALPTRWQRARDQRGRFVPLAERG